MHTSNRISQNFSNRPQSKNIITIESMVNNIATKFKSKQPLDKIIEAITKHLQTIENKYNNFLKKDIYKNNSTDVEKIKTEDKLQYLECIFSICDQPQLFKANTVQNNELLQFIKLTITQIDKNYFDNTEKVIQEAKNNKAIKDSNTNATASNINLNTNATATASNINLNTTATASNISSNTNTTATASNINLNTNATASNISSNTNKTATASNINSNTSVKNTKPTKNSELKTNSPKNKVFSAKKEEILQLRKYMATIILHQWDKPDIQNSLVDTIRDYHYDYFAEITPNDRIWDPKVRVDSNKSQYLKDFLKQIFPNIKTKHEYIAQFNEIMDITNNMNKQPSNGVVFDKKVVMKLIDLFVIPNGIFVHKTWLKLLCKTNELDINQIILKNGHFSIEGKDIPKDGNCAFHCIMELLNQQNLSDK